MPPTASTDRRRRSFSLLLCLAIALAGTMPTGRAAEPELFEFHHEGVLGTSLDLRVRAGDAAQAGLVEAAVLAEIERLRKILSTYDPESEISRFNTSSGAVKCSPELLDVLGFYDFWNVKSGGAYNGHLGDLIGAWKNGEKAGVLPTAAVLIPIARALGRPGWKIDRAAGTATRLPGGAIAIDSLGKGYIISKAAAVARSMAPPVPGFMLNIGGDIFASGQPAAGEPWTVGVADPKRSADNAPPLTQVRISDRAISTSAAYERGYTIGGRRFSHIFDPRTGLPAEGVASATVIAANSANANALATTLCVLKPEEGLALARQIPGVECLIVTADGRQLRSPRFAAYEAPKPAALPVPAAGAAPGAPPVKGAAWPTGYEVGMTITLKTPPPGGRGGPRRPYVAVWVENENAARVRTVVVWGNRRKYLPDLQTWWQVAQQDEAWAQSITRATRPAGQHKIAWDGLDDKRNPVPPGTYTIFLEVNRQNGTHALESGKIVCDRFPATGSIPAASEFAAATITYGPAGR